MVCELANAREKCHEVVVESAKGIVRDLEPREKRGSFGRDADCKPSLAGLFHRCDLEPWVGEVARLEGRREDGVRELMGEVTAYGMGVDFGEDLVRRESAACLGVGNEVG